jgi:hypothetical protein
VEAVGGIAAGFEHAQPHHHGQLNGVIVFSLDMDSRGFKFALA